MAPLSPPYPTPIDTRDFGPGRELIAESTWDWQLLREPDGSLTLSVVCGTIGVFEVEVPLDDAVRSAYEAEGLPSIQRLADEVRYSPRKFMRAD